MSTTITWKPIVPEADIPKYEAIIERIAQDLQTLPPDPPEMSNSALYAGKIGVAVFFAYLAQYTNDQAHLDKAAGYIEEVWDDMMALKIPLYTLCGGYAGIMWALDHLGKKDFIDFNSDEMLEELEKMLFPLAEQDLEKENYDFMHGALGMGVYLVDRLPNAYAKESLEKLVELLYKSAEFGEDGVKWQNKHRMKRDEEQEGVIEYNLGLSHGMPSILVCLAKFYAAGINPQKSLEMLEGGIKYMQAQRLSKEDAISCYPYCIRSDEEPTESRLAWCYGDLGIAITLWQAGTLANRADWKNEAVEIMLHLAKRRDIEKNRIVDAGICHGAAGVAHILNRFYQATGKEEFKEAANYWYEETLNHQKFETEAGGFRAWHHEDGWVAELGILEGAAGIGLCLLAALSDEPPEWDRAFLMDVV